MSDFKHLHRNIGLDRTEKEEQHQGKSKTEGQVKGVRQYFLCDSAGKGQHSHFATPLTI